MPFVNRPDQGPRPRSVREEPKVTDLIERRERKALEATETPDSDLYEELNRIDLMGERFLSPSPERKALNEVARSLDTSREWLIDAMNVADKGELSGIHMRLASIVAEVDSLASDLAGGEAA
jgi:hypothetical protein